MVFVSAWFLAVATVLPILGSSIVTSDTSEYALATCETDGDLFAVKHQSFAAGSIKKCCNLRIQKNDMKNEIAKKMNNSWVRIMNRSLNDRGQISVESLEYADTFLAVPRRKLKSFSRITIHDYSNLHGSHRDLLMNRKFNSLVKSSMNRIIILPLINSRSTAFQNQRDNVVDMTELTAVVVFAQYHEDAKTIENLNVISLLHGVIGHLFGAIHPMMVDNILQQMARWTVSFPKEANYGLRVNEMIEVWKVHKFTQSLQFNTPIYINLCPQTTTQWILFTRSTDHQNKLFLRKLLSIIRSYFPLNCHKDLTQTLGRIIAVEIVKFWIQINDHCDCAPAIHILWARGVVGDVFPTKHVDWKRVTKLVRHRNCEWIADLVLQRLSVSEVVDNCSFCGRNIPAYHRPVVSGLGVILSLILIVTGIAYLTRLITIGS